MHRVGGSACFTDLHEFVDGTDHLVQLQATVKGLEQRLEASDSKQRELEAELADLQQRLEASDSMEREREAELVDLKQRLGASESKECELN